MEEEEWEGPLKTCAHDLLPPPETPPPDIPTTFRNTIKAQILQWMCPFFDEGTILVIQSPPTGPAMKPCCTGDQAFNIGALRDIQ